MANVVKIPNQWKELYDEFPVKEVGAGTIDPNIYATTDYQKKKIQKLFINGINKIIYSGYEHDQRPLVLVLGFETKYNTIIGINLHYIPKTHREKLIRQVMNQNRLRIKRKQPFLISYKTLVKHVPSIKGAVRRYKRGLIRVEEAVPLVGWGTAIQESTKWSLHYRKGM